MEQITEFKEFRNNFLEELSKENDSKNGETYIKIAYQFYKVKNNNLQTELDLKNANNKINELEKEILKLKDKKVKKQIKKGIKLTENQINYIRELSEKYGLSRDKIILFFNDKFDKRKQKLTLSQLRKIMQDNNIKKQKKCNNDELKKCNKFV